MSTTADTRWHPTEEHFALLAAVLDLADEGHLSELEAVVYGLGYCPGTWGVLQHLTSAAGLARFWHHSEGGAELVGELVLHLLEREWEMWEWEELGGHIALRLDLPLCHREGLSLALPLIATLSLEALEDMREEPTAGPEGDGLEELCPLCLALIEAGEGFLCPECMADVEAEEAGMSPDAEERMYLLMAETATSPDTEELTDTELAELVKAKLEEVGYRLGPIIPAELAELVEHKLEEMGYRLEVVRCPHPADPKASHRLVTALKRDPLVPLPDVVNVPGNLAPYVNAAIRWAGGEVGA